MRFEQLTIDQIKERIHVDDMKGIANAEEWDKDEELKKCFIDGICRGAMAAMAMWIATIILFFLMFEF